MVKSLDGLIQNLLEEIAISGAEGERCSSGLVSFLGSHDSRDNTVGKPIRLSNLFFSTGYGSMWTSEGKRLLDGGLR